MIIPATIEELIQWGKQQDISHNKFNNMIFLYNEQTDRFIVVPDDNIVAKYRYYMEKYIIEIELADEEYTMYACNPKLLSNALYDTTEYWSLLLMINNCVSKIEFDKKIIKVLDPKKIGDFINEILILEKLV